MSTPVRPKRGRSAPRRAALENIDAPPTDKKRLDTPIATPIKKKAVAPPKLSLGTSEIGSGTPQDPFYCPLRSEPNKSDCSFCVEATCPCNFFDDVLASTWESLNIKRITEVAGRRHLVAKSVHPVFVSRMVRLLNITSADTFYDLGCGNGSVLFQVAYMTGARCVGVEISEHNAELARQAWAALKPQLEARAKRPMPEVEIITGDLTKVIAKDSVLSPNTVVWTANLLMPRSVTHYMSERFRLLPKGARIMCFDDLYPHSRAIAQLRDPEAFELFEMKDYLWQRQSVEWTAAEGKFYVHTRK